MSEPPPRPLELARLTTKTLAAADPASAVLILPIGMIEQHGPHLPLGTDNLLAEHVATETAAQLAARLPDRRVVVAPLLPFGETGAESIGSGSPVGSLPLRGSTLFDVVVDLGLGFSRLGFRRIFVVTGHGAPTHNATLNDACDFVSQDARVDMVHATAILDADEESARRHSELRDRFFGAEGDSLGLDIHAGTSETSRTLAVAPRDVGSLEPLPDLVCDDEEGALRIAREPSWPGYFSSPRRARSDFGRAKLELTVREHADLVMAALGGAPVRAMPRYPLEPTELGRTLDDWRREDEDVARRIRTWKSARP